MKRPASELGTLLAFGWPVALANASSCAMQMVDLAVVGCLLDTNALSAMCLSLVVVNLTQEPASFIIANAVTTLCASAFSSSQHAHSPAGYLRAAVRFALILTMPFGALLLATSPVMRSVFGLSDDVSTGISVYAPWCIAGVPPSLMLSGLLGFLRAQGRLRTTSALCVLMLIPNYILAVYVVPTRGLRGSALVTAAIRYTTTGLLAFCHQNAFRSGVPARVAGGSGAKAGSDTPAQAEPLQALRRHYTHSLLPATLRIGVGQLLPLLALGLSQAGARGFPNGTVAAACLALANLLLQTCLSLCMGVQQATLMLTSRHLSNDRQDAAAKVMRYAAGVLTGFAVILGLLCWQFGDAMGRAFSKDATIAAGLAPLMLYLAPTLLLKTLSGLYGQFFAVSGNGALGTWILFVAHWCVGLPASWVWATYSDDGALALMQAHTVAWLATAASFWVAYLQHARSSASSTSVPPPPPPPSKHHGSSAPLAQPLLSPSGQPAPPV